MATFKPPAVLQTESPSIELETRTFPGSTSIESALSTLTATMPELTLEWGAQILMGFCWLRTTKIVMVRYANEAEQEIVRLELIEKAQQACRTPGWLGLVLGIERTSVSQEDGSQHPGLLVVGMDDREFESGVLMDLQPAVPEINAPAIYFEPRLILELEWGWNPWRQPQLQPASILANLHPDSSMQRGLREYFGPLGIQVTVTHHPIGTDYTSLMNHQTVEAFRILENDPGASVAWITWGSGGRLMTARYWAEPCCQDRSSVLTFNHQVATRRLQDPDYDISLMIVVGISDDAEEGIHGSTIEHPLVVWLTATPDRVSYKAFRRDEANLIGVSDPEQLSLFGRTLEDWDVWGHLREPNAEQ